jgi:hypothetical protein
MRGQELELPVGMSDTGPGAASPSVPPTTARYVYLMTRLRSKQITMEEATELFSVQQGLLQAARAAAARSSSSSSTPSVPGLPGAPGQAPTPLAISDDTLWTGLLFMGAGAGVLAAILRRAQDGPRTIEPKPTA